MSCKGVTKKNTPCKNAGKYNGYCRIHQPIINMELLNSDNLTPEELERKRAFDQREVDLKSKESQIAAEINRIEQLKQKITTVDDLANQLDTMDLISSCVQQGLQAITSSTSVDTSSTSVDTSSTSTSSTSSTSTSSKCNLIAKWQDDDGMFKDYTAQASEIIVKFHQICKSNTATKGIAIEKIVIGVHEIHYDGTLAQPMYQVRTSTGKRREIHIIDSNTSHNHLADTYVEKTIPQCMLNVQANKIISMETKYLAMHEFTPEWGHVHNMLVKTGLQLTGLTKVMNDIAALQWWSRVSAVGRVRLEWHATWDTPVKTVTDNRLDIRYSNANNYFGEGIYTSDNPRYSHDKFLRKQPKQTKFEMLLVRVAAGNTYFTNKPAVKWSGRFAPVGYDTVTGVNVDGCNMTVAYSNDTVDVAYIVEYVMANNKCPCGKKPTYNEPGETVPICCRGCKTPTMVRIK
uniref:PARP catalytic domain-containing protein n=1 Tax=Megaviridae environmental sample TaxID=1737588 RepID=A0A5J6VJB5_9VIRU|nr:MAG: hypothetical protein [Megaviridae environmental sample]